MKYLKLILLLVVALIFLVAFVLIAVLGKVWQPTDVIPQLYAALAGAAIVALITLVLLQGQSRVDSNKIKETKVFEEKLTIYKDFYSQLLPIIEAGKITKVEEIKLEFYVATLAIHTSAEHIFALSNTLKEMIINIKQAEKPVLLGSLFDIDKIFRAELYGDEDTKNDTKLDDAVANFESISVPKNDIDLYKRALNIKDLIGNVGAKKGIYDHTTLVCEYFTEKNDKGQYRSTKKRIAMDLTPMDDKFVLNIFTREYDEQETKALVQGIWQTSIQNRPPLQSFRHVLDVFDQSERDEDIARTICERLAQVKNYRDRTCG